MGRDRPMMPGPCTQIGHVSVALICIPYNRSAHSLNGTQHPHATNMRVLAIHMVRENDDLENVRVNRFAVTTLQSTMMAGGNKDDVQAVTVVAWLRRYVERDPPVGTVERDRAYFLQIAWARASAYGERCGRVRIVKLVAEVETEFLKVKK